MRTHLICQLKHENFKHFSEIMEGMTIIKTSEVSQHVSFLTGTTSVCADTFNRGSCLLN